MKFSAPIIPVSLVECQHLSWKSQLKSAFSNNKDLLEYLQISWVKYKDELTLSPDFPVRVPRAFADKMQKGNLNDPLLQQVLAKNIELDVVAGFSQDPLLEQSDKHPGLLHKYHGRVLLLITGSCAINCRYCFRRHFPYQTQTVELNKLQNNLDYIQQDETINEVILSGGDLLLVSDSQLGQLITKIEAICHVKRLRIHTRLPVVLPDRITEPLIDILRATRLQASMVVHANHANEIDAYTGNKLNQLVNAGISVFNQSVLLKGINNCPQTLFELSEKLFEYQIIPYYLHLLDPVAGSAHFEESIKNARKIMRQLTDRLPGYLVPKLAKEEAKKPSKTVIL